MFFEANVAKIKLSDTLRFLSAQLNTFRGGSLELEILVDDDQVVAGEVLRARAALRAPEGKNCMLNRVTISLRGEVQRGGKWESYAQRAEAAHDVPLPGGHEYVIPIVIKIPTEAVLSEDGGNWRLRCQALVDGEIDPRDEATVNVVA